MKNLACYHGISIEKNTELALVLKAESSVVHAYHHQSARRVAPGFMISARSADGMDEAIELGNGSACIPGTRFHPEKMIDEAPARDGIMSRFVEKARAWSADRKMKINIRVAGQ